MRGECFRRIFERQGGVSGGGFQIRIVKRKEFVPAFFFREDSMFHEGHIWEGRILCFWGAFLDGVFSFFHFFERKKDLFSFFRG